MSTLGKQANRRVSVATMALVLASGAGALISSNAYATDAIRCLAVTGGNAAVVTGARYASVELASVGSTGSIAFRATMQPGFGGVTPADDSAIWLIRDPSAGGGTPLLVAREGSLATGMPLGVTFAELGQPVLSQSGDSVVFWSRFTTAGGVDASNDRAIYRFDATSGSGTLHPFVRTGSVPFGTPEGVLADVNDFRDRPAIGLNGFPAFTGGLFTGAGGVPVNESRGIWATDLNNDLVSIARAGQAAPELAGLVYGDEFSTPVTSTTGDVVYLARLRQGVGGVDASNDQGLWIRLAPGETHYLLARRGDSAGNGSIASARFETIDPPVVTSEPRVGFRGTMRLGVGGVTTSNDEALWSRCPCGALFAEVRESWPAFGYPAGVQFDSFSRPAYSRAGRMMFGARLRGPGISSANDTTIWWAELPIRFLTIAIEGTAAPGGNGAAFANFDFGSDFWLSPTLGDQMVFPATLTNGVRGIWVFTPQRGLRCVVKEGDAVEVAQGDTRTITSLLPRTEGYEHDGRRSAVSADGHLAFVATVTGGATGLFVADLPVVPMGCPSDWNNDNLVNSQDFFDFLTDFFDGQADLNISGHTDSQDAFDFLTAFFGGC